MKENKNIDAVKLMRNIREGLSKKYSNNPAQEKKDLIVVRKKYGLTRKTAINL